MPRTRVRRELERLTEAEALELLHDWSFWARPSQLPPPGEWFCWLLKAGRGFGKNRAGAEWIRGEVETGRRGRLALVAETAADARDVMIEGPSGILAVSSPRFRPRYEPSKRRLTWPNGAMATIYSADDPEQLRGPEHDGALADELGKWRHDEASWDNLMMGLRRGSDPRVVAVTTPRPTALIKRLISEPGTVVTHGTTHENRTNLAPSFFSQILRRYKGTRLGRQEIEAELLEDAEGALWRLVLIDKHRAASAPALMRVVVAIDPAATSKSSSNETGIIVAGVGADNDGYVLDDLSGIYTPDGWGRRAVQAYDTQQADTILGEQNNGGEMVEHVVRTAAQALHREGKRSSAHVVYRAVHASRGKRTRAEPVAALYEQGRVHHVGGLSTLEDQMCSWEPNSGADSPDRMDANVWALTDLMVGSSPEPRIRFL